MRDISIPEDFAHATREVHGERGDAWLAALPGLLAEFAARWSLTLLPPFAPLTYNYVTPAVRADGTEVVVKAGVPHPELASEIGALRLYGGRGSVHLLEADPARGVLLLERLRPGTSLETLLETSGDDETATIIAAGVMHRMRVTAPVKHVFPTVATWAQGLERLRSRYSGGTGPLPPRLVERAERLYGDLSASRAAPVVLHGDLHHGNILSHVQAGERDTWLAIDPKGVVGEAAYEAGALLRNPVPWLLTQDGPARILARRVDLLAEQLALDRERILGWGFYQAVLSAWWWIEDHGEPAKRWESAVACADLLASLLR